MASRIGVRLEPLLEAEIVCRLQQDRPRAITSSCAAWKSVTLCPSLDLSTAQTYASSTRDHLHRHRWGGISPIVACEVR